MAGKIHGIMLISSLSISRIRKMGWSYPELSIEDLIKFIKSFVDMLILACGYQSTGRLAHWDPHNINRSFQWALFIENVSKGLMSSAEYDDSVKELDAALHELTMKPHFPQDLAHLSCSTLSRARDLMLERLIHTFPMRESHLRAIVTASVEMDLSKLKRADSDSIDVYLERVLQISSKGLNSSESRNFLKNLDISTPDAFSSGKIDNCVNDDFSVLAIQKLGERKLAVSRSSDVEAGLENVLKIVGKSMSHELGNTSNSEQMKHSTCLIAEELPLDSNLWNCWRSRSLSYMLDKRTIRMISGASLIFSAPECQWAEMFERLNISAESDDLCETVELLLLGCVADRWSALSKHLMSVSYVFPTISRIYNGVFNLLLGKSPNVFLKEGLMKPKERSVVNYLEVLLSSKINQLWKLSPVLAAIAIPSWSQLFRSYLHELEGQLRGNSLATRYCSCIAEAVEHRECGCL